MDFSNISCTPVCLYKWNVYFFNNCYTIILFSVVYVTRMGEERGVYRVLVGKLEGKRPLGRPRHRWVDNIRMDLLEVRCGYVDWIELTQDRDRWRTLVSAVMNLRVPWNAGNFLTSCKPVSCSRRTLHHGVSKCYGFRSHSSDRIPRKACNSWIGFLRTAPFRAVTLRRVVILYRRFGTSEGLYPLIFS